MKILHTADWHLGTFRSPVRDGINLRTEDTKRCLDELLRVAKEEKTDYCLISGDVFDVGRLWSDRCCEEIVTAIHYIRELCAICKEVVVMRGTPNHDGIGQFKVLTEMFGAFPNVHIVVTPQVLSFDDADIAVLPGFDRGTYRAQFPGLSSEQENEVFTKELANIVLGLKAQCNPDKTSILMAHYTVPGCNTESGQTMLLAKYEPVIAPETLLTAGYDLVALGHIHRPQQVLSHYWFYSGAINQMNFNDEGQERGFWIHEMLPFGREWDSIFYKTPFRDHITFNFTDTDITAINLGNIDEVAFNYWRFNGAVQDKIVRIFYSCSAENSKAVNKALVEKTLLEDGAFMLWEMLLDNKTDEVANKTEIANVTDPEANLVKYLEEKQVPPDKIQELVLKARPIIAEAEANMPTIVNTGMFEPVEISVRNYRNYEEETFNFEDITFCTINGQNGAGKSSLFMDAILDCLYEQPREGVIKDETGKSPWLRNDESARSGSIMFTFRIGEKKYRVTRTRARSGKGTLNLSCFIDGRWEDCSKERYNDTQQEILDILGMDSFTFKSCALIMQDQYGLFLQAKPEERVEVLGELLGLGIYKLIEKIAQDKAKVNGAKNQEIKKEIEIHSKAISDLGNPDEELSKCQEELGEYENVLTLKVAERDKNKLLLTNQQEAAERRFKLTDAITALQRKKETVGQNRINQQAIIDSSAVILNAKEEIKAKAAEHKALLKRELELAGESALYSSKKQEAENLAKQAAAEQQTIGAYKEKARQKENELSLAQPKEQDAVIRERAEQYTRKKAELEKLQEKAVIYQKAKTEYSKALFHYEDLIRKFDTEKQSADKQKKVLEKKVEILKESGCVDIENAHCKFLQDAVEAKERLYTFDKLYTDIAARQDAELKKSNQTINEKLAEMSAVNFDADVLETLRNECMMLLPYVSQLEAIKQREGQIALLEADIKHLQINISEAEKRLAKVKSEGIEAEKKRDLCADAFSEHVKVQSEIASLEPWTEKEMQIPVAEEKNATATKRILELTEELLNIDKEILEKQAEADKEILAMRGMEELAGIVAKMNSDVEAYSLLVKEKQMNIGALQQKARQVDKLKKEISMLQDKQMEFAKETADYDALKIAFSQSGVPHQIIRSIIPQLTETSNTILEQMTGGRMGVEFRLERLQKNGKEKVSLDIFIEEYGKSALPYLSKSGGEKVKSSLAVILALAEIKSLSAGVQMGMLFIDEPPFLDSDGTEAYVEALETIRGRYSGLKIMAITHDYEFKAKFPESVTVIKDENGSHVKWD